MAEAQSKDVLLLSGTKRVFCKKRPSKGKLSCCIVPQHPSKGPQTTTEDEAGSQVCAISPSPECPECGSNRRHFRDGLRYLLDGSSVQRWLCRSCGFRFSEPKVSVDVACERLKALNSGSNLPERRVRDRNLAVEESVDDSSFSPGEDVTTHELTTIGKTLYNFPHCSDNG